MKAQQTKKKGSSLTPDSQHRLLAYTTAAGVGAFFAGQNVEAQVTASSALAPYPHTLQKGLGTGYYHTYNYLDIDGDGTIDFNLNVDNWRVDISGTPLTNLILNPFSNAYVVPWTDGMTLDDTTGSSPTYRRFLANSTFGAPGTYLFNNFNTNIGVYALGFKFTSGRDGQPHFGYMNIEVNGTPGVYGDFSATVKGIFYNATPNAEITIGALPPATVKVTKINVGAGNAVTIDFTSSDNASESTFTVESSPVLGASASWTADVGAVITSSSPGVYQAVTTGTGGTSQFFRIVH